MVEEAAPCIGFTILFPPADSALFLVAAAAAAAAGPPSADPSSSSLMSLASYTASWADQKTGGA